ncbi:PhzF family phenazine biosynthesis protein [Sandarakinorhabdus oryzae]|uniref:PhzF family phenazine biosynthesis protein n=1 Tax=Sandarakinorhabdus oryzae TaxID=2675220 RepID=UPI0012E295F4|nr:PhzF family phenazine biosynthesis protein [Sandarakinorhabdus oryzae]
MRLSFQQVDAFADGAFTGNPAAVMFLPGWLPDRVLQGVAADNNLSETAFLVPHDGPEADFQLRWFTPLLEVALCGHATLASGHVVLDALPDLANVRFLTTQAGVLSVARDGDRLAMRLPAWPADRPVTEAEADAVAAALGARPVEVWARSRDYLVAVFDSPDEVRGLQPDHAAILGLAPGIDLMLIATAPGEATDVLSRVFVPACGVNEDPVTGSAHAVIAPFWAARFGRPNFTAVQASARGGRLDCRVEGDSVILTGKARTVIRGEYDLPDAALNG